MAKATAFSIARTDDLEVVRELAYRIWPVSYTGFLTPEQIENMLARIYNLDALRAEQAQGHRFFLAQVSGQPVGYASSYRDGGVAWLKKLYLLPEQRGSGIAEQLLEKALARFPTVDEQRLLVNVQNHAARRFYERLGFRHRGDTEVQMGDYRFTDCVYVRPCAP